MVANENGLNVVKFTLLLIVPAAGEPMPSLMLLVSFSTQSPLPFTMVRFVGTRARSSEFHGRVMRALSTPVGSSLSNCQYLIPEKWSRLYPHPVVAVGQFT